MRSILAEVQGEYSYPVDMEYTINIASDGEFVVNLLQCRPLQVVSDTETIVLPETTDKENILFECVDSAMGLSSRLPLDIIVYVDPVRYYEMPYNDKYQVASAIHKINWKYREENRHMMLMAPGRIGTSSPELGVPTSFADISEFEVICEIAKSRVGYMPELSYGSHFFQDLVEAGIIYTAIFDNEKTRVFQPEILQGCTNLFAKVVPGEDKLTDIIRVCDLSGMGVHFYHDIGSKRAVCIFSGIDNAAGTATQNE